MRYTVTLGRTKQPAEYESIRVEHTQEFDDEETPKEAGWMEVKAFVQEKIKEELAEWAKEQEIGEDRAKEPSTTTPVRGIPKSEKALAYTFPGVEQLPWRTFKEKGTARPNEEGWLFTNTRGAEELVEALRREGAVVVAMDGYKFLCKLSGKDKMFVNRTLPKEAKR